VDKKNIKQALARRVLLDTKQDVFWLQAQVRVRSDSISNVVKNLISKWWDEETTVSPNRKDIVRRCIAPKVYIEHAIHYI